MRRNLATSLLLIFAMAETACGSSTDEPPPKPDDPVPEGTCDGTSMKDYPSFRDYSANMELTGENGVKVTLVSSDPAPPTVGDNVWTLKVTVNDAVPPSATIKVSPKMPVHGHPSTAEPVVTDEGNGTFRVDPVLFMMAGFWDTKIDVKAGDVTDTVRFGFCAE